jgi:hypothetical protein
MVDLTPICAFIARSGYPAGFACNVTDLENSISGFAPSDLSMVLDSQTYYQAHGSFVAYANAGTCYALRAYESGDTGGNDNEAEMVRVSLTARRIP